MDVTLKMISLIWLTYRCVLEYTKVFLVLNAGCTQPWPATMGRSLCVS